MRKSRHALPEVQSMMYNLPAIVILQQTCQALSCHDAWCYISWHHWNALCCQSTDSARPKEIRLAKVYIKAHMYAFASHPNANSLIQNPFRTKTKTCERKQTNATWSINHSHGAHQEQEPTAFLYSFMDHIVLITAGKGISSADRGCVTTNALGSP
jgi:hypothetical protein